MTFSRTTGLAITAKEFAQWLIPLKTQHLVQRTRFDPSHSDSAWTTTPNTSSVSAQHHNIGVAVSGGVDSMALLTLLARHFTPQIAGGPRLHAFIVDHKLRVDSTQEATYVADQVRKLDVTPHILTLSWSKADNDRQTDSTGESLSTIITRKPGKSHLETQARLERYKAIALRCHDLQIQDLFVGHHAGDQVETVLFRFSRASGIDGLSGVQQVAPLGVLNVVEALDVRVLRPLLQVTKDRLQATCEDAGVQWVEDPSNRSLDYQRNVIRHYQQEVDTIVQQDRVSALHPLSTPSLLAFRERMEQHRRFAWDQMRPWLQDVRFDSENGVCHIRLRAVSALGAGMAEWLQASQNHVATRLLSFLVRWVSAKDHAPRLEDIQLLLKQLRMSPIVAGPPAMVIADTTSDTSYNNADNSDASTVYRKRIRISKRRSSSTQDPVHPTENTQTAGHFLRPQPINVAGVLFSPPRTTKGIADHWTLSRQPISSTERMAITTQFDREQRVDFLWDQRFFIRISGDLAASTELQVRPLIADDIQDIYRSLETRHQQQPQHDNAAEVKRLKVWIL
ncbi:hypothetical protein BGZ99_002372 [Dissophora globulifera]|uniref:tRNA(Ile)-lysidine synthetase n=1 Tax=Dissophora globulifera TaxID=979702 RepID=A0A9P6RVE0_9FUNG|nr:hypothetical protein BGZ99_002372 [Dissophora globulifera]